MRILVYDVAAENGGAVTILNWFYSIHKNNKNNQYIYLIGNYKLESKDNITVINVPNVKKSWFHRLYFDFFGVKKYIKKYHIEYVLSLQNTIIPFAKMPQTVYVHNALPFSEYRYRILEDKFLWIYQNLIGFIIKKSIKKADKVIVQTNWMKDVIVKQIKKPQETIEVKFPEIKVFNNIRYSPLNKCTFFYPANSSSFKNHIVILEASKLLYQRGITNFRCVFTLNGNENELIKKIYEEAENLNMDYLWIGQQNQMEMAKWYAQSVLIFPSYIETIGLPICEAMSVGAPVLLSDCLYARDVADKYENAEFFRFNDEKTLSKLMELRIKESSIND